MAFNEPDWADAPSNGVFRFYWADHEEFEYAHGPFNTFDDAKAAALKSAQDDLFGPEPGSTIYIAEADKRLTVAPDFDLTKGPQFDRDELFEWFLDKNADCWSEDGFDSDFAFTEEDEQILLTALSDAFNIATDHAGTDDAVQAALKAAFTSWLSTRHSKVDVYMFGTMKNAVEVEVPELTPADLLERSIRYLMRSTGLSRDVIEAACKGDAETVRAAMKQAITPVGGIHESYDEWLEAKVERSMAKVDAGEVLTAEEVKARFDALIQEMGKS
ncbi:hypothetical protein GURKE_04310 [Brevundimonas phage vB_BpoS-Gurke]|uniref:Uncharacterized protein n=1 Tax=Brevundimonas phage vB_BpoS-Gurke TaxID=2948599 RepID=A0A9E7N2A6_9CAUD|nr:hypothetical protein GURKE_04310 [Brevundimonas phage vB_BpoS-Gurke]